MIAAVPQATDTAIDLQEYRRTELHHGALRPEDVERLVQNHGQRIAVEYPHAGNGNRWGLTSRGWAGVLPVSSTLALRLRPRVEIQNIFRMLEVAYRLKSFELLPGRADCHSLEEFFERLAHVLARRILARSRKGLYRSYVDREDRLGAVRGRIDLPRALRTAWEPRVDCQFQEHTADLDDNRILLWTLHQIRRSAACRRSEVRDAVRSAFHRLAGVIELVPARAENCRGRTYDRLNADYRVLHALCHFFLDSTGPTHQAGDQRSLPFLVSMPQLFELFVAEWLAERLAGTLAAEARHRFPLGSVSSFEIDLVLRDRLGGSALAVADMKYKINPKPKPADIAQVVAYAEAMDCRHAWLIYPQELTDHLDVAVGRVRVRSATFDLSGDLDAAGARLMDRLLAGHRARSGH